MLLKATIVMLIIVGGCDRVTKNPAPSQQSVPVPGASMSKATTLPQPVRDAFQKDRNDATILKIKHRTMTDQMVHYTITSTDENGARHEDEYRSDGMKINASAGK